MFFGVFLFFLLFFIKLGYSDIKKDIKLYRNRKKNFFAGYILYMKFIYRKVFERKSCPNIRVENFFDRSLVFESYRDYLESLSTGER